MSTVIPVLMAFAISVVLCPIIIPFLKKMKFGQYVRDDGPKAHLKKAGTPTMGGLIILACIAMTSVLYIRGNREVLPVLFATIGFGLIGFLDDYIKVVMKRSLGLTPWQKIVLQAVVAGIFVYYYLVKLGYKPEFLIPFSGGIRDGWYVSMPVPVFVVFVYFVMLGTVNGTNFTDGLDGLASSVTLLVAVFFTIVASGMKSGITPVTASAAGSLMGFLLYNVYPASVFMGDTGSLALGGFVASAALMLKLPVFIIVAGAVYLIEVLSVIIQVVYFKASGGKRFFKMAPIHHHFEQCGWSETKVVTVFSLFTAVMCILSLAALYI
ncbi:MAG: phospho-N-acetylmuramoyl-pentapeptide-transferase [Lachnospiraceae bacterium]|nr:phospho-N-acetylmuramoyl-pentapeptide-transferase [Lachnospiraceae bacterium]